VLWAEKRGRANKCGKSSTTTTTKLSTDFFQKLKTALSCARGNSLWSKLLFFSSTPLYRIPSPPRADQPPGSRTRTEQVRSSLSSASCQGVAARVVEGEEKKSLVVLLRVFYISLSSICPEPCALSRSDCRLGESGVGLLYHTIPMPMDRSPDCMDLDVGDDRRGTAWWEDLTKDSVRMQELVGKLNPGCSPIDETRPYLHEVVDIALKGVYYDQHPSHTPGTPIPGFYTARAYIISVIDDISRRNPRNAGGPAGGMGAFTSTLSSFLNEGYPESAPFNGEALHSRVGDSAGDEGSVSSSHGGSGGLGSGGSLSLCEGPRTTDRSRPCDTQPHSHSPYVSSATPTLSDCPTYSPGRSNSSSPGPSSATDGCRSADEKIRPYSFSSTLNSPRRPRINSHSRSVLNRGQPPIHTGHHFDVPPPRFPNGAGPGGQHKCDECGKTFPYPSKLK